MMAAHSPVADPSMADPSMAGPSMAGADRAAAVAAPAVVETQLADQLVVARQRFWSGFTGSIMIVAGGIGAILILLRLFLV